MIEPASLFAALLAERVNNFSGVPDSLLKDFCAYVVDHTEHDSHVIAANEGNAVALACGHYLGTGEPALVYMQNSGIGNAVNPLLSLADPDVYGIPMLLLIGWRGEPGVKDEPQHIKQGRRMHELLDAMEMPYVELTSETPDVQAVVRQAVAAMHSVHGPAAILVKAGTFTSYQLKKKVDTDFPLNREEALKEVVNSLHDDELVVATTGKTSRELYEYRAERGESGDSDFLTVGGMGHTASISMGLARARRDRKVVCLDGDGSVLMHMGALAVIGCSELDNLVHVVFNNGAHDSVGGQPTVGFEIDLCQVASACGYRNTASVSTRDDIGARLGELLLAKGPVFLEVKVNKGARGDLGRPKSTPAENRDKLMQYLGL